jgi:hypothetical protein
MSRSRSRLWRSRFPLRCTESICHDGLVDDFRRALEWESRGFGWLRAQLVQYRDHVDADAPAVGAMRLSGWPERTHLLFDYVFWGEATTKDMDLWYGDYLNPPRGDRPGDDQMIATIGWSEFLEETLHAVTVPMPQGTYPDLDWEHGVLEMVRVHVGLGDVPETSRRSVRTLGVQGWPRETELFVEMEGEGATRTGSWPLWPHDARVPGGEPGDAAEAARALTTSIQAV